MKEMFLKGGPLMWPLLICSILSLAITIERLFYWWRERCRMDGERLNRMLGQVEAGDTRELLAMGNDRADAFKSLDYIGRILVSGLRHRNRGLRESIEIAAEDEMERMKQGLNVLDTIITMAPLLGILGTVLGIISSFELLGSSGIEDPKAVTGGIAQALITTAAGLAIALMTLVPFNYFVAKVNKAAKEMNKIAARFEAALKNGAGKSSDDIQRL
ncbi:MAG: MotA/TolQ/ExbB proton channel family protein [Acidobacteria bacterium]|nr:MotA/TolQ/ExbB proton channel family protein [Acidobacteriota bacterium]